MDIETAFKGIHDWYEGDYHVIHGVTSDPMGSSEDFEQSDVFLSVRGEQRSIGMDGDSFEGEIYFEYEPGKYIFTKYYS